MAKKKTKQIWGGYNKYTYIDGEGKFVKFIARDDSDAELYRQRVKSITAFKGDMKWDQLHQIQKMIWERFTMY